MNDNSRTEADAAHFAAVAGASEHDADAIQPPVLTPYCSVCQRGTGGYVCGPCMSAAWWCPRCDSPSYVGAPEDNCPDCGYETENR